MPADDAVAQAHPETEDPKVPGTYIRAFTGEMDFGVVTHPETLGDKLPLMQISAAIPGGGVIQIEFPAGFTPQVITAMKACFDEWADTIPGGADLKARAAAAASGIEVPVIGVPADILGENGGKG